MTGQGQPRPKFSKTQTWGSCLEALFEMGPFSFARPCRALVEGVEHLASLRGWRLHQCHAVLLQLCLRPPDQVLTHAEAELEGTRETHSAEGSLSHTRVASF